MLSVAILWSCRLEALYKVLNTKLLLVGARACEHTASYQRSNGQPARTFTLGGHTHRGSCLAHHGERLIFVCEDVRNRLSPSPYIALVCGVLIPAYNAPAGAMLLAGMFIKLNTAMAVKKKGEEVLVADGHVVALKYVRSGAILTDFLTILPTILQVSNGCACHVYSCYVQCISYSAYHSVG